MFKVLCGKDVDIFPGKPVNEVLGLPMVALFQPDGPAIYLNQARLEVLVKAGGQIPAR